MLPVLLGKVWKKVPVFGVIVSARLPCAPWRNDLSSDFRLWCIQQRLENVDIADRNPWLVIETKNLTTFQYWFSRYVESSLVPLSVKVLRILYAKIPYKRYNNHGSDLKSGASECGTRSWRAHFDMFDQASVSIDLRSLERVEVAQFRCWQKLPGSLPT